MFRFDRTYAFAVPPQQLWDALVRVDGYREWWPWLRELHGDGLVTGAVNHVAIWAPVPWMLRLRLTVTRIVEGEAVDVTVDGDLTGTARLRVATVPDTPATATARLVWELRPSSPAIRVAGRFARPVLQRGQDWVVSIGIGQFRRRGLGA